MLELLNKKLNLVKKIEELTSHILDISLDDDKLSISLNECNSFIDKRQEIMNEIDNIDCEISKIDLKQDKTKNIIEKNIKAILKNIIDMDKKIKLNIEKELEIAKTNISKAEQRLQTSNFELNEEDKKPIGYYLNKKS